MTADAGRLRPLEGREVAIIRTLLAMSEKPFEVADLTAYRCRVIDECGSLELVAPAGRSSVGFPVATGLHADVDSGLTGARLEIILFADGGALTELQIFKQDGSPIRTQVEAAGITSWDAPMPEPGPAP